MCNLLNYMDKKGYDVKFIFRWIVSSIIGFGMSVWIYIPLLNYAPFSKRSASGGGAAFDYATSWSLHPYETLSFILPSSFGFGELTYFGYMPMTNFPNYSGIIIIFMSLFAFYKASNKINYFFFFPFTYLDAGFRMISESVGMKVNIAFLVRRQLFILRNILDLTT